MSSDQEELEIIMSNNERSSIMKKMQELYAEKMLTDFVICARDEHGIESEFSVHRIVLAASEGFFSALVNTGSEMVEGEDGRVELPETDPELLARILDYIYGANIKIEISKLVPLLGLAIRLQIRGLSEQISLTLKRSLSEGNCCQIFIDADKYGCPELRQVARDAIVSWLATLARSSEESHNKKIFSPTIQIVNNTSHSSGSRRRAEDRAKTFCIGGSTAYHQRPRSINSKFSDLPAALALEVLESDRISCDETVVFDAAASWVLEHELRGTKRAVDGKNILKNDTDQISNDILRRVRYPLIDATYLADVVKPHPAMRSPTRQALITEAFEHLALRAAGRDKGSLAAITKNNSQDTYGLQWRASPRKHRSARCRAWPPRLSVGARLFEHYHSDAVAALCVCADKVVSGSWDSTVRIWNADTGDCECTIEDHDGTVRALCDLDGRLVSASEDGKVRLFDPRNDWALTAVLADHASVVNALVSLISSNGSSSSLVVGSHQTSQSLGESSLRTTSTNNQPPLPNTSQVLQYRSQNQFNLRRNPPSPGGLKFASGSDDGSIKIWSASDLRCQLTLHSDANVGVLVLASLSGYLAAGSDDGSVRIFDTRTWTLVKTLDVQADEIWALTVVGEHLVSGSVDRSIQVFDTRDWSCVATCRHHYGPVYALTSLQNHLISGSSDETIIPYTLDWEPESNEVGVNGSAVWCFTVHNDRLVTGGVNGQIRIWDLS